MQLYTSETTWRAQDAAKKARAELDDAEYAARKAELLEGAVEVGCDDYSGEFWPTAKRPPEVLSGPGRTLYRLPNGDWFEELGGKSWTRYTYDLEYALDRVQRARIGGYVLRSDAAAAVRRVIDEGADVLSTGSIWGGTQLTGDTDYTYAGPNSWRADEMAAKWVELLRECRERDPKLAKVLDPAIEALSQPDSVREFIKFEPNLSRLERDIRARLEGTSDGR